MADEVNVLLTCVGRRVGLLEAFRKALADLGLKGRVYGADHSRLAAAFHRADEGFVVPSAREGERYVEALAAICSERRVALLVPLLDWELEVLAEGRKRFEQVGTRALISSPQVVRICRDKVQTFEFLNGHGFDTPAVLPYADALRGPYPLFMKPRFGSSAKDVRMIPDRGALEFFQKAATEETVIQEFVDGWEHTVDVYAGLDGAARVAVPRRRLKVRDGEVTKAVTVRHGEIIRRSMELVDALGECVGVVTLQCFLTSEGRVRFIEINPRFGGGVPLAMQAGADFPRWLIEEHLGRRPDVDPRGWKDRLVMLRYDEAVFCPAENVEDLGDDGQGNR